MNLSGLLSFIGGAISGSTGAIISWASAGFATLFGNDSAIASVLGNFIKWATGAIGAIVTFIGALWKWLRDSILKKLIDTIRKIHDYLKNLFKPITDMINRYRLLLRQLFQQYVKPILDFLQRVRKVLLIFRLLGFKWAKQLDARIVKFENEISAAFLGTWRNLNILSDWINFIVDPLGLIQPGVWLGSIRQSIGAIIASVQHAQLSAPPAYTAADQAADDTYFSMGAREARSHLRATTGPLPDDLTEQQDMIALWAMDGF
jgi:hypothetical protein